MKTNDANIEYQNLISKITMDHFAFGLMIIGILGLIYIAFELLIKPGTALYSFVGKAWFCAVPIVIRAVMLGHNTTSRNSTVLSSIRII